MAKTDIGIDFGARWTRVWVRDKGILLKEPSVAAFDKDKDKFIAFGEEAASLSARATGNLSLVRPLREGSLTDYAILEEMLYFYIQRALGRRAVRKPFLCIATPAGMTAVEKRAMEEAAYQAGAREVTMVPEAVAAAIGAGIDIAKPFGNLVVDIGYETSNIALISIGSPIAETTLKVGGKQFDDAIMRHIRRRHSLYVNESEAERVKMAIGSAVRRPGLESMEVRGRNVITGSNEQISITQEEIRQALYEPVEKLVDAVHGVLEKTPPELAADIVARGIVLTGGGAMLDGFEERITERTGINAMTAENADLCVAQGTGGYVEMIGQIGK